MGLTRWEVWRQDDNGNRYRVSVHDDRAGAEAVVSDLESGVPHKQIYWIVEVPGSTSSAEQPNPANPSPS